MKTSISIAMATFNGEKYVKEQLESLATQTALPLELVVCDDCSSDGTVAIISQFALSAPFPVRIYRNEANLGYSDNFLKAAGLCCGQWVAFCDQDDVWLPRKLACLSEAIDRYSSRELMLVAHTSLVANHRLKILNYKVPYFPHDSYIRRSSQLSIVCIPGFALACRAAMIKEIDPRLRPITGHDDWITMLANVLGDSFHISEPLAIWRRHDQSTTSFARVTRLGEANKSIKERIKQSLTAVDPGPYTELAKRANATADSFLKISRSVLDDTQRSRLSRAAADNLALAAIGFKRAELYEASTPAERMGKLLQLLKLNSYFGRKYCALGWKSFVKDTVFAIGCLPSS